jgi:putative ABC transport system ATP-binding protein
MPLIEFNEVYKIYHTGEITFPALQGTSFTVNEGAFLALAGPSGSGKTTILNIIGCLDKPTRGTVLFEGRDLTQESANSLADLRRHHLGFIFQTFNLIPVLSAYENVEFPLLMMGETGPRERRNEVERILIEVGLKDLMNRRPAELSGGQQQRVAIARALVKKPRLILADEPTANLDSKTGQDILTMMRELNRQHQATFIFSTHDPLVLDHARRILTLQDGRIVGDHSKE